MNEAIETKILLAAKKAIGEAITTELIGYNKPLNKLTQSVIEANSSELFSLINDEFSNLLSGDDFKEELKGALRQKLAKTLIARMGGELERQVNELRQNPQTRAKITLAITEIVDEL